MEKDIDYKEVYDRKKQSWHQRSYGILKNYFTGRMFAVQISAGLAAAAGRSLVVYFLGDDLPIWETISLSAPAAFGMYIPTWIASHRYFFREYYKDGRINIKSAITKLLAPEQVGSGIGIALYISSFGTQYGLMSTGLNPIVSINLGSWFGLHKIPDWLAKLGVNSANSAMICETWSPRQIVYKMKDLVMNLYSR